MTKKPLIRDFFSHKIHTSTDGWEDWICTIAHVFNSYDGYEYDREKIIETFNKVAPSRRWSAARCDALFRDELTAYIAYLGICCIHLKNKKWFLRMSQTAKEFLLGENPDVGAFLRLQLSIWEIPFPMGMKYNKKGTFFHTPNARDIFNNMSKQGVKVSFIRLLITALKVDAYNKENDIFQSKISFGEIYTLANQPVIYRSFPNEDMVFEVLSSIRSGSIPLVKGENRFGLLKYTDLFNVSKRYISIRSPFNEIDKNIIKRQIDAIENIKEQFQCSNPRKIRFVVEEWGIYYDAIKTLPSNIVKDIATDISGSISRYDPPLVTLVDENISAPRREFNDNVRPYTYDNSKHDIRARTYTDPNLTQIKKERRNIAHANMVDRLCSWLETSLNAKVGDSMYIDIWAQIPESNDFYIFEVKSGGDGIMAQLRKGISQLYEYRYRYRNEMKNPHLCLVLPENLPYKWLSDYLCRDRGINLCFLEEDRIDPKFHELSKKPIYTE